MATVTTWLDCYLNQPVKVRYLQGNLFTSDNNAHKVGVKVYSSADTPASLSGTVSADIVRSDGVTITQSGTLSGNQCSVTIPAAAYAVPGTVVISIKLTDNSVVTTLGVFACEIYDATQGSILDPGTIIPSIESLIIAIERAVATIPLDYSGLNSAFASMQDFIHDIGNVNYRNLMHTGKYTRYTEYNAVPPGGLIATATQSAGVYTDLIELAGAKEVSVYTAGSTGCAVIAFYDASGAYISGVVGEGQTVLKTYKTTTIPSTAKYVRFSGYSNSVEIVSVFRCFVGVGDLDIRETAVQFREQISTDYDIDSITENGVYLLSSGNTYTNTPSFYSSGLAWVVVITNPSGSTRVQLFMNRNNWACRQYASGSYYGWKEYTIDTTLTEAGKAADAKAVGDLFSDTMKFDGRIQTDTDFNNIAETGAYLIYSGHTYTNAPPFYTSGSAWMFVMATSDGNFIIQLFYQIRTGAIAYRTYNTSSGTGVWGNWRSSDSTPDTVLSGKKFSVLGDSISTYQGYIPSGYAYYYPASDTVEPEKSVDSVSKTWWKIVENKTEMTLLKNASWSGSGVCFGINTGDTLDNARVAYSDNRINDLADRTDPNNVIVPDVIIVLIGTNDFRKATSTTGGVGNFTETSEISGGSTEITMFNDAYACMLNKIHNAYPNAHVFCCTLLSRSAAGDRVYPVVNEISQAISQYNTAIDNVATWLNCDVIRLDSVFNLANMSDYTLESTAELHPNSEGMKLLANRIIQGLVNKERKFV